MKLSSDNPRLCAVCGQPAEYCCDHIVSRIVSVPARELRRNDQLVTRSVSHLPQLRRRTGLKVDRIETIHDRRLRRHPPRLHLLYVYVDVNWTGRGGRRPSGTFIARPRNRFRVERRGRCGSAVCFRHVREAAENVHYCETCAEGIR